MTTDQLTDKQYQRTIEQLGDFLLDSYIKSKENGTCVEILEHLLQLFNLLKSFNLSFNFN